MHEERAVRDAVDPHPLQLPDRAHDRLGMSGVDARHGHVTDDLAAFDADQVDRAEQRVGVRDRAGDARDHTAVLGHVQAHREAVAGGGLKTRSGRVWRAIGH